MHRQVFCFLPCFSLRADDISAARYRQQRNRELGWGAGSWVPLKHYTRDEVTLFFSKKENQSHFCLHREVALAPGPLFWDIEASDIAVSRCTALTEHVRFGKRMCTQCAFPFPDGQHRCSCAYCVRSSAALEVCLLLLCAIAQTCFDFVCGAGRVQNEG